VSKRAWLVFAAIQTTGSILASYGTVHSESAFVRVSWLVGFLLLLPGNIPAMAVGQTLLHVRSAYIFFPIAIACNVILWLTCSAVWRIVRRGSQGTSYTYSISFAAVGLVFAILNTVHFLRPPTCWDCFFPYGVPFTLYHDGGYAGGNGFVWGGLAADVGCVVLAALLVGCAWERIARARASA